MKRTLSFMVMALALLLTQCRKPEVKFPSPVAPEGTTVSMTVTAGPGSKTDITTAGAITWRENDKLYVGFDGKYVGCLEITSGVGTPTGWFSGNVTLPTGTENGEFHFFYLGSDNSVAPAAVGATSVNVLFNEQNIYKNGDKLENAKKFHIGYGSASGTVKDGFVTGINVTMVSKVAIAYFSFKDGTEPYYGALTLSGTGIYNSMKVNFGGSFTGEKTGGGNIILDAVSEGITERYVMLVPPANVAEETLNFGGAYEGTATLESGIEANKFYRNQDGSAIEVTVEKVKPFTVGMDNGKPRRVEFAPGNLYWDGTESKFKFEANQWDFRHYNGMASDAAVIGGESTTTPEGTVGSFFWSKTASVAYASSYSDSGTSTSDVFFTNATQTTANPDFTVNGETGTWRTLSKAEWIYLLKTRANASSLGVWKYLGNNVNGLVILPDGTENPSTVLDKITSTADLETYGAVWLPAAGYRDDEGGHYVRTNGDYWTSTPYEDEGDHAYRLYFRPNLVNRFNTLSFPRTNGYAVRLVR